MRGYDAIIVGAGPAGSAAAIELARSGAEVLLLDKQAFPREKLCAGILTRKSLCALKRLTGKDPQSLLQEGVFDNVSDGYRIRCRSRELLGKPAYCPFYFVTRRDFDYYLLSLAQSLGAGLQTAARVRKVCAQSGEVTLESGETIRAKWIIGADGAQSRVRKACAIDRAAWRQGLSTALEFYLPKRLAVGRHPDLSSPWPTLYAGFIKAGYAWVFPHRESLAIGLVGLPQALGEDLSACFDDFIRFLGIKGLEFGLKSRPLPFGNHLEYPAHNRALLAGDAAGFADALFGEGIFYALRSGELAGQAVARALRDKLPAGPEYVGAVKRELVPEFNYAKKVRNILHFFVNRAKLAPLGLGLRLAARPLEEMVHGDRSYKFLRKLNLPAL